MSNRAPHTATVAAMAAAALGLGHAAVSAYWAAGGTRLLATVGGALERWGRERDPSVVVALVGIAALKGVVAVAAPVIAFGPGRLPRWTSGRVPRILGWVAAIVLTTYGGLLTVGGLLIESGLVDPDSTADRSAQGWHAYFWDPWYLLWGSAFVVSLWLTRPPADVVAPGAAAE